MYLPRWKTITLLADVLVVLCTIFDATESPGTIRGCAEETRRLAAKDAWDGVLSIFVDDGELFDIPGEK